jgi:hypothetical protein
VNDKPHIEYYNMGQWPLFVGFTTSEKAFKREMKRLQVSIPFIPNERSTAAAHYLERGGDLTVIITMRPCKGKPVEQIAGLLAHEAVHVAQQLWENIGESKPGREAEAYLVQMITQCCLQDALKTNRVRKEAP